MLNKRDYKLEVSLELLRNYRMLQSCEKLELWFIEEEYG